MSATQSDLRIDDDFLRRYEKLDREGEPSVLKELIRRFMISAPQRIKNIRDSISEKQMNVLRFEAHALKGIVGNVGANKLARLCQIMEIKGENNSPANLEPLFQEIADEYQAVADELQTRAMSL